MKFYYYDGAMGSGGWVLCSFRRFFLKWIGGNGVRVITGSKEYMN